MWDRIINDLTVFPADESPPFDCRLVDRGSITVGSIVEVKLPESGRIIRGKVIRYERRQPQGRGDIGGSEFLQIEEVLSYTIEQRVSATTCALQKNARSRCNRSIRPAATFAPSPMISNS